MYMYNYKHIEQAASKEKGPPTNKYAQQVFTLIVYLQTYIFEWFLCRPIRCVGKHADTGLSQLAFLLIVYYVIFQERFYAAVRLSRT